MVLADTSTGSRRGLTLLELLVAVSAGSLVLAAVCVFWGYSSRNCAMVLNYMELANASRNAVDVMTREIRNAQAFKSVTTNKLVISELNAAGALVDVTFEFDPRAKTLRRTGDRPTILLSACNSFTFSNYVASPIAGSFALTNTMPSTNTSKFVEMQWKCSRVLRGDTKTTEALVATRVLRRN